MGYQNKTRPGPKSRNYKKLLLVDLKMDLTDLQWDVDKLSPSDLLYAVQFIRHTVDKLEKVLYPRKKKTEK